MKKKLLSLVLAGAMVASTSVSAFADSISDVQTTQVTIQEGSEEQDVNIGITGNVLDTDGNKVPGTISVTVPTATNFSVDASTGQLISPEMTITNNSDERLAVVASKFIDSNGQQQINVIKKTDFEGQGTGQPSDNARGSVWLALNSGTKIVGFTSENEGKIYDYKYQSDAANSEIGKISARGTMTLQLEGKGGTNGGDSSTPIKDTFKLILKIKRDRA